MKARIEVGQRVLVGLRTDPTPKNPSGEFYLFAGSVESIDGDTATVKSKLGEVRRVSLSSAFLTFKSRERT